MNLVFYILRCSQRQGSHFDFHVNAAGKFKFHQRVNSLVGGVVDIDETLERRELELLTALLLTKVERFTVKMRLWVGRGMGPLMTAPVAFTVLTIFSADLSTKL